ncbi:hypothetical protein CLV51_104274 [Chitinophaga niastensis]|uniref:Uncharacterized protein n=1 Tax=Chitinophaga niastensis TaxID=536980 RepID=A0A2P8HH70_CHINA|nr:hypothetical protein [Chitinophaga niastensis]PSL45568.1 hypothetical protein CLV51_104274 [Chitinophaga niastensis]
MEFEELQKIWDLQNSQPLYTINEKALYNRIAAKKKQALHITNTSELLLIIVYIGSASFILGMNLSGQHGNIFMFLMAAWIFIIALYLLMSRIRRIKGSKRFDRSIGGDLSHAISTATYQVRLSQLMRWNMLPIGILALLGVGEGGKPAWVIVLLLIFFAFAYYAGGLEHSIYKARKRDLEILQNKLKNEASSGDDSSE